MSVRSQLTSLGVRHLDQYFGAWAVLEQPFRQLVMQFQSLNLQMHVEQHRQKRKRASVAKLSRETLASEPAAPADPAASEAQAAQAAERRGSEIAVVELVGVMTKYGSSMSSAGATVSLRRQIQHLADDENVGGILLRIDSPGGTVAGTPDLAKAVAYAASKKPVYAYAEDLCASGAYWVASQATELWCNANAIVGSIGAYMVVEDSSGAAAAAGVKVHVVRSGEMKGAGMPGTEITPEQLADFKIRVDAFHEQFVAAVAAGREIPTAAAAKVADGRVHVGEAAKALDLVDEVGSEQEVVTRLRAEMGRRRPPGKTSQAQDSPKETTIMAATYKEIVAACIGADATFIVAQLDAGVEVAQAQTNWMAEQQKRLAAAQQATADAEAKAKEAAGKAAEAEERVEKVQKGRPGTDTVTGTGKPAAEGGAAQDVYTTKIEELVAKGKTRHEATQIVARKHPELRQQLLAEANPHQDLTQHRTIRGLRRTTA
ncbi:MAG TPA: S49 family peptidase [Pirellulales bacterium]|jgi:signal peptide peptidase SppA|nr:S49 family peptidase [Pirellulales bacterium]